MDILPFSCFVYWTFPPPSNLLDIPPPSGLVYWTVPTEAGLLDIPPSTYFATFLLVDVNGSSKGPVVVFSKYLEKTILNFLYIFGGFWEL